MVRVKGRFSTSGSDDREFAWFRGVDSPLEHPGQNAANSISASDDLEGPSVKNHSATFGVALLAGLNISEPNRWPRCRSLTLKMAEAFWNQYKTMAEAVPFAVELSDFTLDELLSTRPILLLTAIVTGGSSSPEFEKQADELFRHILADRVIVRCQRSLELLQSLLTYMTWYHHRFDPETVQFWQFLQLANGMYMDLGLPKKYAMDEVSAPRSIEDLNEIRAFLLCFYLNCGGGVLGFDRSENMRCIESVRSAARILAESSQSPLEKEAPAVVELLDVVIRHHNAGNSSHHQGMTPASGFMGLQELEKTHLRKETSATITSSFHFITAYTVLKFSPGRKPSTGDVQTCVHHFNELLSNILKQDCSYVLRFGIVEWGHLITTLFLLARLGSFEVIEPTRADGVSCQQLLHQYVGNFRSLLDELRAHSDNDMSLNAPHLLGWLDKILAAVLERASLSETSAIESDRHESAYELVNSFIDNGEPVLPEARHFTTTLNDKRRAYAEEFWSEFMSDWLNW